MTVPGQIPGFAENRFRGIPVQERMISMAEGKRIVMSAEGLQKLKEELEYKQTTEKMKVAAELDFARSLGDLSENAEYDAAKNNQAALEARIDELKMMIENAVIADETTTDRVGFGSIVRILDEDDSDAEEEEYTIVGTVEANPFQGRLSNESPIGMALMGAHLGEVVEAHTPGGVSHYRILEIRAD